MKKKAPKKDHIIDGITEGFKHLKAILALRLSDPKAIPSSDVHPISLPNNNSPWVVFIKSQQPSLEEYLCLLLAMVPHFETGFLDEIIAEVYPEGNNLPAFGGTRGKNHRGILPTGETVQFVLAGKDSRKRLAIQQLFSNDHWFATQGILHLEQVPYGEPFMSGRMIMDAEWMEKMTTGQLAAPRFSNEFPAEQLTTSLEWKDLVLATSTASQVKELNIWIDHHQQISEHWDLQKHLKPGYRTLFYGPPGTGKTLTATLIGKSCKKPVFRVDLSMVVSKFIGETEKNLSTLFDKARNKNWILFFDEADALFGKRTDVRDAHDKYANQEVSFLLQRIESHPGMVILASNFRTNVDDAFSRRFQSIIHFPFPKAADRLLLWQKILPKEIQLADNIQLEQIAQQYELSGSNIVNIVQYFSLQLLAQNSNTLELSLLLRAIQREYLKEGKLI